MSRSPLKVQEFGEKKTILLLFPKLEKGISDFSLPSHNWGGDIQLFLSPLESGEIIFNFSSSSHLVQLEGKYIFFKIFVNSKP